MILFWNLVFAAVIIIFTVYAARWAFVTDERNKLLRKFNEVTKNLGGGE